MKTYSVAELIEMQRHWVKVQERLMAIRAELLELEWDQLIEAHGLVVGIMCALERVRGRKECGDERCDELTAQTDRLIRELRESTGPL